MLLVLGAVGTVTAALSPPWAGSARAGDTGGGRETSEPAAAPNVEPEIDRRYPPPDRKRRKWWTEEDWKYWRESRQRLRDQLTRGRGTGQ